MFCPGWVGKSMKLEHPAYPTAHVGVRARVRVAELTVKNWRLLAGPKP